MNVDQPRNCPLCGATAKGGAFPYATRFNNTDFKYLKCAGCSSVYVDPIPDDQTFSRMYAKDVYHDCHYEGVDNSAYLESAHLLRQSLSEGATVLDYGCGVGEFLQALGKEGFIPYGVEFDRDAAKLASKRANCTVLCVSDFSALSTPPRFDAIHLGDVLEHLPDPAGTLKELMGYLKPGGTLFVEGPLEINPSVVYWAASFFGWIKHILKPGFVAGDTPTHLFRTGANQQLAFFKRAEPTSDVEYWRVYEAGWPYISGGPLKRFIARIAIFMGGWKIDGLTFGNRFQGLFSIADTSHQSISDDKNQ
jgi:2-polyprenyl-3-methyl-5-hydroxy-6-metoxy-1,4-benzoquinol methylase